MVRVNIKGTFCTYKTLKDGTRRAYWYHRATMRRLEGLPGSPEFIASYAEAERFTAGHHEGTFTGLVREYTLSPEFGTLAERTQKEYKRMLTKAELEFDDMPLAALEDPRVLKEFTDWRAKVAKASGNREADNRLSAISAMLTWARGTGRLMANHLAGFKRLYHVDRSDMIWLPGHVTAFMKVAPIEMQRALIIALHTGQRQGDILRLPWSAYDGSAITLRQGKSRRHGLPAREITVPCTAALKGMLDGMTRVSPLILTTTTGRAFKARYFGRLWEETAIAAGVTDLHFHDLRGTAVTLLSEAGATPQQIATITGHSLRTVFTILERYLSRTRTLAEQAIVLFENSARTEFANRLQTAPIKAAKKGRK